LVVDASVAAAWFLAEEHATFAAGLLTSSHDLTAPDLLAAEVGNALVRAFRRQLVTDKEVHDGIQRLISGLTTLHPSAPLLPNAADLACRLRCSIYDAAYLELARRTGAIVVTNDARLAEMAAALAVHAHRPGDGPLPE
jgi:predicted nucleic acid-binding protein